MCPKVNPQSSIPSSYYLDQLILLQNFKSTFYLISLTLVGDYTFINMIIWLKYVISLSLDS